MVKNWDASIAEREALLGADTVNRMALIYVEELSRLQSGIAAGLKARDTAAARKPAHDLVTNAGSLGFDALCAAARAVEEACVIDDLDKALTAAHTIAPLADESVRRLRQRYEIP